SGPLASWQRIFATERPTVPKPISPIFSFFPPPRAFFAALVLDERDWANDRSPHLRLSRFRAAVGIRQAWRDAQPHIVPKAGRFSDGYRVPFRVLLGAELHGAHRRSCAVDVDGLHIQAIDS